MKDKAIAPRNKPNTTDLCWPSISWSTDKTVKNADTANKKSRKLYCLSYRLLYNPTRHSSSVISAPLIFPKIIGFVALIKTNYKFVHFAVFRFVFKITAVRSVCGGTGANPSLSNITVIISFWYTGRFLVGKAVFTYVNLNKQRGIYWI